jgi:catechol 2,3-dioxygenase-like lactoylglutathione lyase family enzyme
MRPHVGVLTLGVADLDRSRQFYVEGLGWPTVLDVAGEVIFIQVGHGLVLSLWDLSAMIAEAGPVGTPPASVTLGHLVDSPAAVARVLDEAAAAGGTVLSPAVQREWGGVSGYFADPDGYRWEIAFNPSLAVDSEGRVHFGT